MSITEIEAEIAKLPPEELNQLMSWLERHYARIWDEQIAYDLDAGRLDSVLAEVDKEYEAGLAKPL